MENRILPNGILYSGNYGSFSWEAARRFQTQEKLEGPLVEALDPPRALERWINQEARHAVVAIFNQDLGGPVPSSLEALRNLGFRLPSSTLSGEAWLQTFLAENLDIIQGAPLPLPIQFSIYGAPSSKQENIKKIAAYSMAINQCDQGILREVGHAFSLIPYSDTGKAGSDFAKIIERKRQNEAPSSNLDLDEESQKLHATEEIGVLGPTWFGELFGLKSLWANVQNNPSGNTTFFILLTHSKS